MVKGLARVTALWLGLVAANVHATGEPPAQTLVRDTTAKVREVLQRDRELVDKDPQHLRRIVDAIILPHFDFERMSQRVLGKYWPKATPDQRQRFVSEFQQLLVRTYATALKEYSDQAIEFLPMRDTGADEVTVRTQVIPSGGPPIPISYDLYRAGEKWKVFDVTIDGVSLVINYRSTFASEVRQGGIDGLIERLVKHNAQGAAGQ